MLPQFVCLNAQYWWYVPNKRFVLQQTSSNSPEDLIQDYFGGREGELFFTCSWFQECYMVWEVFNGIFGRMRPCTFLRKDKMSIFWNFLHLWNHIPQHLRMVVMLITHNLWFSKINWCLTKLWHTNWNCYTGRGILMLSKKSFSKDFRIFFYCRVTLAFLRTRKGVYQSFAIFYQNMKH